MYLPAYFAERDRARIHAVIDAYPFGQLICIKDGAPEIAHVPFLLDASAGTLGFHVARGNPIVGLLDGGQPATAVITGPDAYVSAAWYEQPKEQVPTWNYIAVHITGRVTRLDRSGLKSLLEALSARHEPAVDGWSMGDVSPDFAGKLMDGIVGFTLGLDSVEAKFKLSQNRSSADRERVRVALDAGGRGDITRWMVER